MSAFYQSELDRKVTALFPWMTITPTTVNATGAVVPFGVDHTIVYEQKLTSAVANLMAYDLSKNRLEVMIQVRQRFDCSDNAAVTGCRKYVTRDSFQNLSFPVGSPGSVCQSL